MLAASAHANSGKWIVDETSNCGTSNPFFTPGERIRWQGDCADGKLQGQGTLVWYQSNQETERNEGTFQKGEFHGDVVTTYPDGQLVYGQYADGVRHGRFVIVRIDGQHMRATYDKGDLRTQSPMTAAEVAAWRRERYQYVESPPVVAPQASERIRAKPAAPQAEPSGPGWGKKLLGTVTGWFGFGDDEPPAAPAAVARTQPVAPANRAPASGLQVASAPPSAPIAAARPQPSAPATAAPAPRAQASYGGPEPRPPAVPRIPVTIVVSEPFGGDMYDMGVFLSESHPFGNLPTAKSAIPVVPGTGSGPANPWTPLPRRALDDPNVQVVVQPGRASPQLANGWKRDAGAAESVAAVVLPPPPSMGVDGLFTRAYQLERAGQAFEAEQAYEQILMNYPSSPSAQLANSRLNDIRKARHEATQASVQRFGSAAAVAAVVEEPDDEPEGGASGRVVAVNSPVPARVATRTNPHQGLNTDSPDLHRLVCTRPGLYDNGAKWCGTVRRDEGQYIRVEVADVELPRFGTIGISRSVCTGNTFLNWFSRGSLVLVPKTCMVFQS